MPASHFSGADQRDPWELCGGGSLGHLAILVLPHLSWAHHHDRAGDPAWHSSESASQAPRVPHRGHLLQHGGSGSADFSMALLKAMLTGTWDCCRKRVNCSVQDYHIVPIIGWPHIWMVLFERGKRLIYNQDNMVLLVSTTSCSTEFHVLIIQRWKSTSFLLF